MDLHNAAARVCDSKVMLHQFIYVSYLSICLSIYLSTYLSIYLPISLPLYLSIDQNAMCCRSIH